MKKKKKEGTRWSKNFRLMPETCRTLAATSKRLRMSERFIVEWLIQEHSEHLQFVNNRLREEKE